MWIRNYERIADNFRLVSVAAVAGSNFAFVVGKKKKKNKKGTSKREMRFYFLGRTISIIPFSIMANSTPSAAAAAAAVGVAVATEHASIWHSQVKVAGKQ